MIINSSWIARFVSIALVLGAIFMMNPRQIEARGLQQTAPSLGTAASFAVLGG